ncbi:MAG: glycine--tRNA ligase subunit beta [Leptotrichiaceae bacterium]|nr:glycine--tRNA ligase subunit beta [Leptotrichiaceae bacterium]MBP7100077.1 glycine--tRNA ligase subunit beta [Leptotrichiaceae bacterium]MBP7725226.1 glycine--tRNA ligase subunit beta [Leptotrichiaceae bacterium]MBP9629869.1 glycine--tRNA ligase subunit beta [Leptotrichiaceae bacterium]
MNFLFEIGLEELPSRYVDEAESNLKKLMEDELKSERISFSDIESFSTPRRIAIIIKDIADKQEDLYKKSLGPSIEVGYKDGRLTKAGEGFIKSQGATEDDIKIIENEKGKYILIDKFISGKESKEILPTILFNIVNKIEFEKSMKWSDKSFRFARPIKWFVTLLDKEIIPFEFEGIKGGNITRGMRYFSSQNIELSNPLEYEIKLKDNFVIPKKEERKSKILESIKENCETNGDIAIINKNLLEEVTNLVEYPYALKGEFSKDYLLLPEDIITITMETHQRYFPVKDENGNLSNKFILIRNSPEYSEIVKKGNEKVIEPRLADAKFFFDEDLKNNFEENVIKLKEVTFQKDMGTIYDKITRSLKISEYLISELGLENEKENILRTVKLSKADLVTNVIGEKEFTKLQGFMGSIYAEKQSENKNVALGIFEHYLPRYQGDKLPSTVEGAISGISDKIDTVVGCFSVGLKPTSSKDPYALRRAVQGIVQVILNSKLQIDYKKLINKTYEIFSEDKKILSENVANDVIELFKQRISNVLSEKFNKELVSYEINLENNLVKLENKLSVLLELSKTKDFEILINLLKRVKNIVKDINKEELVSEDLFEKEEEKELFNLGIELEKLELEEFSKYIEVLLKNANVINNYFDNIKINTEDEKIKNNRVATLKKLEKSIDKMISI